MFNIFYVCEFLETHVFFLKFNFNFLYAFNNITKNFWPLAKIKKILYSPLLVLPVTDAQKTGSPSGVFTDFCWGQMKNVNFLYY